MKFYGLRRQDGLLIAPAIMAEPDSTWKTIRENKAASDFGGVWQWLELDADTYEQAKSKLAAGRSAYFIGGNVTSANGVSVSTDKTSILANDTDSAAITLEVDNAAFAGAVRWRIIPPEGAEISGVETMSAGVATLNLTTEQIGTHQIWVDVLEYGSATLSIEGVE